jgi:hypothetical protein
MPKKRKEEPTTPPIDQSFDAAELPYLDVPTSGRGGRLKGEIPTPSERKLFERALWKHELRKTRPWRPDEYIFLDGVPCVYTPHKDIGTIVHLRGGGRILLRDAYVRNLRISGPRTFRIDDIYSTGAGAASQVREQVGGSPPGSYENAKALSSWQS